MIAKIDFTPRKAPKQPEVPARLRRSRRDFPAVSRSGVLGPLLSEYFTGGQERLVRGSREGSGMPFPPGSDDRSLAKTARTHGCLSFRGHVGPGRVIMSYRISETVVPNIGTPRPSFAISLCQECWRPRRAWGRCHFGTEKQGVFVRCDAASCEVS